MRVLVCGSRTWTDENLIEERLCALGDVDTLIEGGAPGADTIAYHIAKHLGWDVEEYRADWKRYGKAAGFVRNSQMLMEGKPDLVLAFWDGKSRGTKMMIEIAEKAGVRTEIILGK